MTVRCDLLLEALSCTDNEHAATVRQALVERQVRNMWSCLALPAQAITRMHVSVERTRHDRGENGKVPSDVSSHAYEYFCRYIYNVTRLVPLHKNILGRFPYAIGIGPGILSRAYLFSQEYRKHLPSAKLTLALLAQNHKTWLFNVIC